MATASQPHCRGRFPNVLPSPDFGLRGRAVFAGSDVVGRHDCPRPTARTNHRYRCGCHGRHDERTIADRTVVDGSKHDPQSNHLGTADHGARVEHNCCSNDCGSADHCCADDCCPDDSSFNNGGADDCCTNHCCADDCASHERRTAA